MFDNISAQTKNAFIYTFAAIGAMLVAVAACFGLYKAGRAFHTGVTVPVINNIRARLNGESLDENEQNDGDNDTQSKQPLVKK